MLPFRLQLAVALRETALDRDGQRGLGELRGADKLHEPQTEPQQAALTEVCFVVSTLEAANCRNRRYKLKHTGK